MRQQPAPDVAQAERDRIDRVKQAVLGGQLPPSHPKSLTASVDRMLFASMIVLGILSLGATVLLQRSGAGLWSNTPSLLMSLAVLLMIRIRSTATRRAVRRILAPHDAFVCPRCHYPLSSCPEIGQCPECGTLYTRSGVIEQWKIAYSLRRDWATK